MMSRLTELDLSASVLSCNFSCAISSICFCNSSSNSLTSSKTETKIKDTISSNLQSTSKAYNSFAYWKRTVSY